MESPALGLVGMRRTPTGTEKGRLAKEASIPRVITEPWFALGSDLTLD